MRTVASICGIRFRLRPRPRSRYPTCATGAGDRFGDGGVRLCRHHPNPFAVGTAIALLLFTERHCAFKPSPSSLYALAGMGIGLVFSAIGPDQSVFCCAMGSRMKR